MLIKNMNCENRQSQKNVRMHTIPFFNKFMYRLKKNWLKNLSPKIEHTKMQSDKKNEEIS